MIGHLLVSTLTVHRPISTDDGLGGTEVVMVEAGDIAAQVSQPTPVELQVAAQWGAQLTHVIHAAAGADVRRGDELAGDLPSDVPEGRRLRVISTVSNSRTTYTRVLCEVVQAETPESS